MSPEKYAVVVTTISHPNQALQTIAEECGRRDWLFICIGDSKTPADFSLDSCDYYSVERQRELGFEFANLCPLKHYARKNIGYLIALRDGASIIVETDDDNFPRTEFWGLRERRQTVPALRDAGWVNAYRYFSSAPIWPRGLPLDAINQDHPSFESLAAVESDCPIQQGLADENPDVDAIYRLILPLPQNFRADRRLALANGSWCPFNSQNTTWWREAFPLLYLPAYCSFRMTDIWRSFVAQRIAWERDWSLLFHEPTVYQERNEHSLMRDFADEVPGYLRNREIGEILTNIEFDENASMLSGLKTCYERLTNSEIVGAQEMALVEAWTEDVSRLFDRTGE
ncbi:MAG: DUF288 domain-containing protein [Chthoniobacterales bacterium]|jgi:hypothetical protein|nr:DUF288 domain-containing protein [Chthoniobacterales bacterium]